MVFINHLITGGPHLALNNLSTYLAKARIRHRRIVRRRAMPWTTSTHAARQRPRGEHRPTTAAKKGVATGRRNVEMWEHVGKLRENVGKLGKL